MQLALNLSAKAANDNAPKLSLDDALRMVDQWDRNKRPRNSARLKYHNRRVQFQIAAIVDHCRSDYARYRQTPQWREKRNLCFELMGGRCRQCGGQATEIHHLSYERLGFEIVGTDIVPACTPCHAVLHKRKSRQPEYGIPVSMIHEFARAAENATEEELRYWHLKRA